MPDNTLNILWFGDVVGRPGRQALQKALPELRTKHAADVVIANVENMAHGFGITPQTIEEMREAGVNLFTSGNHIWKNQKGVELIETEPKDILRPANMQGELPGTGVQFYAVGDTTLCVVNFLGEVFMKDEVDSPFEVFDAIYKQHGKDSIVLVDLHAEATGEKRALSWYIDGRASALVGTHTHVPTADAHVMPKGLAYVSDLGMTGATHSSLGMDVELVLEKVARKMDVSLEPPSEATEGIASGVVISIDIATKQATHIERIDQVVAL